MRRQIQPMRPNEPVVIVGGGPVGLALGLGLARQGVRSVLLEKKPSTSRYSKAPGIHVRTREIFRQWGIEHRFLAEGTLLSKLTMRSVDPNQWPFYSVDFSDLYDEADRPGLLILEQADTERILLDALRGSGWCDVRFGAEAVGLEQDDSGVRITVRQNGREETIDAEYAVGCDGAGSFVRETLELPFDGATYDLRPMLADVRCDDACDELPWPRVYNGQAGLAFAIRLRAGLWRIIHIERGAPDKPEDVPDEEVRRTTALLLGERAGEIVWASRFRIHVRSAPHFRVGRVLLAGDAAHVHSPIWGFGMNGGIQDAHNLAWKLAHALEGGDVDRLLDSYDIERRAVIVETVSAYTDLLTRLFLDSPAALRAAALMFFRSMLYVPGLRRRMLRRSTMIDLDYPASPLLDADERAAGVRLPNPLVRSPHGEEAVRLYDLLGSGPAMIEVAPARGFVPQRVVLERLGTGEHPQIDRVIRIGPGEHEDDSGLIRALLDGDEGWIFVRPDLHVAFASHTLEGIHARVARALGTHADRLVPAYA